MENKEKEVYHLRQAMETNGYPLKVNEPLLKEKKKRNKWTEDQQQTDDNMNSERDDNTKKERTMYRPHVRVVSEMIERTYRSINTQEYHIRTVFKPIQTIRHMLTKVKSKVLDDNKKGVVIYEIRCEDCKHVYLGEINRTVKRRTVKHKQVVKKFDKKNGVAVHANTHDHCINREDAKVVTVEHAVLLEEESTRDHQDQNTGQFHELTKTVGCPLVDSGIQSSSPDSPSIISNIKF